MFDIPIAPSDYIDDVSSVYPRSGNGVSPIFPGDGRQRGYSNNNDWYAFAGLTFSVRLGSRGACYGFD